MTRSDVKYIQSLAHKKHRQEEGLFVVEGVKMVDELLLNNPDRIRRIYATAEWTAARVKIVKKHISLEVVEISMLDRVSFLQTSNEVLALVSLPNLPLSPSPSNDITLMLDTIQDPGNLGTILRTADWFGVRQVICSLDTCDAFAPKVVQASMGSLMRLDIFYTDLEIFLNHFKEVPIYTTELTGESVFRVEFKKPMILVIGNEAKGVSSNIANLATKKIMIPRVGDTESLNASVATGIVLAQLRK